MKQAICDYGIDDEGDWFAKLKCGHNQHVRHRPPFILRPWVITKEGRQAMVGYLLECKKCDTNEPRDWFDQNNND
ncbi:DUF3565 domain-containing protein [Vibrio sp.]|nr:DUF3565 domain-containing protein [Vibrio sp.]